MNEELEALKYTARQQNLMDHLTKKMYGPNAKFERLSAFGQYQIETLARQQLEINVPHMLSEARGYAATIRSLEERLAETLKEVDELLHERDGLLIELEEYENRFGRLS